MPDWRKADNYRFPKNFPSFRWAWEFLRRNPEYRNDWQAAFSRFRGRTGEFGPGTIERSQDGTATIRFTVRPAVPDVEVTHRDFRLPAQEGAKWFVAYMCNPETEYPSSLGFLVGYGHVSYYNDIVKHELKPSGLRYPWAVFDIELPVKPQIESVRESLLKEQKRRNIRPRRVKHHRNKWPLYLRLLDAALDERKPKQIANVLDKESREGGLTEGKIWNQLKAARALTQPEGYLSIFLSKPRS